MIPHFELLRTRVARRVLLLFVLGALAPVVVLAVYSFTAVTDQLREQSRDRLQQLSKNAGMSVMERLQDAEVDLRMAAADPRLVGRLRGLRSVTVSPRSEHPDPLAPPPAFREAEWNHLRAGGALLRVRTAPGAPPSLWLVRARDPGDEATPLVWGHVDADYLWGSANEYVALPTVSGFCILAGVARRLHCADGARPDLTDAMVQAFRTSPAGDGRGVFHWSADGEEYVGSNWELFLRGSFQADPWSILVSESQSVVYAPLRRFGLAFPPVLLFGLIVVTLLANAQVRRTMEPLEELARGTRRIAAKEFDTRVDVDRDDEFGELARSFNTMAERLGVQFRHLEASRAIDQAVLSASDPDEVVQSLLAGFGSVVPYERLAVLLLDRDQKAGSVHWVSGGDEGPHEVAIRPTAEDVAGLAAAGPHVLATGDDALPRLVRDVLDDLRPALVLPLSVKGEVRGALMVARPWPFDSEEVVRARQIVDQAAVALDEVQLVAELEEMSWGTLRALARAIDAKSRWTAGHSERVVRLALAVAREMGVEGRDLDALERGGLLHDIGKIGIPADVLDAEGPLTPEQRELMQQHVIIGARILEPVPAYQGAIPIVLHHHERWDGGGYPDGLAGEDIPLLARILGVADAYDAMSSTRPYRSGRPGEAVLRRIEEVSGTQFDPAVVDALLRVARRGGMAENGAGTVEPTGTSSHG